MWTSYKFYVKKNDKQTAMTGYLWINTEKSESNCDKLRAPANNLV